MPNKVIIRKTIFTLLVTIHQYILSRERIGECGTPFPTEMDPKFQNEMETRFQDCEPQKALNLTVMEQL
jgi:hypothetical protein